MTSKNKLKLFDMVKDSIKYVFKDWKAVIILGIIINLLNVLTSIDFSNNLIIFSIIILFTLILTLFEMGYSFKIIEESLDGSIRPPIFNNFKDMLVHGIKDIMAYIFYGLIIVILIVIFLIIASLYPESLPLIILIAMISTSFIFLLLNVSLVNLALNHGKIKAIFNIKDLSRLLIKIGLINIIVLNIVYMIVEFFLYSSFVLLELLSNSYIISLLYDLIVSPFLIIFSKRLLSIAAR
ncbi:DUF4013 domain-containing protein [Methanobrevibacter sp. DSM 116169]|uniref:DUF4013 domain-containing protein n=1 Tax=Methanobrevibacter sp. DSM 116169 TaxID=3242727 RepID=UPI0038FCF47F